jgi:hypothetical protein
MADARLTVELVAALPVPLALSRAMSRRPAASHETALSAPDRPARVTPAARPARHAPASLAPRSYAAAQILRRSSY